MRFFDGCPTDRRLDLLKKTFDRGQDVEQRDSVLLGRENDHERGSDGMPSPGQTAARLFHIACLMATVLLGGILAATANATAPVKITPTPFYADLPRMRVTFTTPRPAPAGYLYFAWWQTSAPPSTLPDGCSGASKITSKGVRGGNNLRVTLSLYPEPIFGDAFCPGPSQVDIFTQRANRNGYVADSATAKSNHRLTLFRFRVLRPI